jgi:hypothetical protein
MASEPVIQRYRNCYAKLLRLYPKPYRERFGEAMKQTFNDLCRERVKAERGLFSFAIWMFFETSAGIIRENATSIMRCTMQSDCTTFLKFVKYSGITVSALMVAGIAALMLISRGKGEDITGIVAPALLVTIVSSIGATVAAVLQKRAQKASDRKEKGLL